MSRYARQALVFGPEAQTGLAAAHVMVIGAGGLGAPVLSYLAGAGVGRIDIVDPDVVSLTNLHRQTLFETGDIGTSKAHAAAHRLKKLNPEISVTAQARAFDPASGPALIAPVDLVLDCADSFAASYTASDLCRDLGKPLITASVLQRAGYVCGVCGGAPSLRAVFPDPPDKAASCATAGVSGPTVGLLGAAQAQMALDVLTRTGPSPLGLMVQIDAQSWRCTRFRFDHAEEPETALRFVAPADIRPEDLVIELRGAEEAPVPVTDTAQRLAHGEPPPRPVADQRTVLACATGLRAWRRGTELAPDWPGEIVLTAAPAIQTET